MEIRRPTRTAQLALAATVVWAAVVVPFVVLLLIGEADTSFDEWTDALDNIPALSFILILPAIAFVLSVLLSARLLRGDEVPRDRGFAIALLGPGIAWLALAILEYLV